MKAKQKERQVMQHPRMTNVFEERNTKQSQQLMEIRPKELENVSDWYAWSLYWNTVPLHVEKIHTLVKDLDDKLDEEGAVVSKRNLIDWVIEYRERRQALLFCVDFMLSLTNEETQRQLSRSVTEWDEFFAKLESSWGYWFPDVQQMLKCPIDGTKELKLSQMTNGTSADSAMRFPRTRKLRQKRVHQAKPNCVKKTASEKESLTRSRKTKDQESCGGMRDSISEVENSINDVTSLLEENSKVSDVTILMDNRPTVSTKWSNGDRLFPLALEKAEDQKSDEVQGQRSEAGQLEIEELGKHPKLVETRLSQTRLEKLKREAIQMEIADLHEQLARKARIAEKERELAGVSSSQGTSFPSVSSVDSFTEDSRCMAETETVEDGAKSNIELSVHLKSENAVKFVHEGKFSALRRDSKPPTEADEQADDRTCRKEAISQPDVKLANQGTPQLITTECIQKLSETFIVDNGRQDVRSETLLVDTKQVLEEDIHLGMSEHSISQTKENLNHTMTETRKEHRSLSFASSKQTLGESSVQHELLQESAEVFTVQQDIQQGKIIEVTMFHDSTLLLEEGNKCFEFDESYGFVHEQQFALLDDCNEEAMYRKLCHVAAKHDEPVECNAKGETRTVIATFGKKFDFDFKVSLVEETIPSNNNEWNPRIGNGNSGMDAVAQANGMDKTQLSKGHRKRPKKQAWMFEHSSNRLHGMVESVQLTTGILYAKIVIDDFADEISLMETQLGSPKAQTITNSENGPFIGPAVSWEEMMMQLQFFGKWIKEEVRQLEVNDLVWIVDDNVKRAHYKMGRVLEVYHGSDGRVRSALVKTEDGKLKRPVVKLAPMFYESVFQEKNRAGNVGASHQQAKKVDLEHAG